MTAVAIIATTSATKRRLPFLLVFSTRRVARPLGRLAAQPLAALAVLDGLLAEGRLELRERLAHLHVERPSVA